MYLSYDLLIFLEIYLKKNILSPFDYRRHSIKAMIIPGYIYS